MFFSRRITSLQLIILFVCILALLIGKQMKDLYDKHQQIIRLEDYNHFLDEMAVTMKSFEKRLVNHSHKIRELSKFVKSEKSSGVR